MYGLSAFFIGEQRVTDELGPIMRAAPTEEMRIFLSTQIADEARHVRFFNRFYDEVGVLDGTDDLAERLARRESNLNDEFGRALRRDAQGHASTGSPPSPRTPRSLVEAITLYHMVIEGVLALTGQHFIISYNEELGTLPGFVEGFGKVARDEHRHVAFGARFLTDMAAADPTLPRGDPAHAGRVAAGRRGRAAAAVRARGRRRVRALRRLDGARRRRSPPSA